MINPEWLKSQGFNISECGATCAASAAHWSSGINYNRFEARDSNPNGSNWLGWWNLHDISNFLLSKTIAAKISGNISEPRYGVMKIFRVRGNHFVMTLNNGAHIQVYSTLFRSSVRTTEWDIFRNRINWGQSLSVYKKS